MRLLEHQSKTVLAEFGLEFSRPVVVSSAHEAAAAARELAAAEVLLKAQVPVGGRAKAGAVNVVDNSADTVIAAAAALLDMTVSGWPVTTISVESKIAVAMELFVGITWDTTSRLPVALLSNDGGVDIETASEANFRTKELCPSTGLSAKAGSGMAASLGLERELISPVGDGIERLASAFLEIDAVVAEINPLAVTADLRVIGLDAHVEIDDDALYRQETRLAELDALQLTSWGRPPTSLELKACAVDAMDHRGVAGRVVEFDGDLALLIGGGGARDCGSLLRPPTTA